MSRLNDTPEVLVRWSGRFDPEPLPLGGYPDGMPLVTRPDNWGRPTRLLVRPSSVLTLMTALWFVDAVVERGFSVPELILPNVPGARQDRLNPTGDYLFTLKSVAREINLRQFPKVVMLDPHSDVAPALIERSEVYHVDDILRQRSAGRYTAVVSPDAGAEKRAGRVAKLLDLPLLRGWKTRNIASGAIAGFGMEPTDRLMPKSSVLVVDDICDGGGTFIGLGDVIRERGLRADLWTTHGLYTKGTDALGQYYDTLYTTDSICRERTEGVVELTPCATLLQTGHL